MMIGRRELLGGTVVGRLLGGAATVEAAGEPQDIVDLSRVVDAIDRLRSSLVAAERTFSEIAQVRDQQKQYLKLQGKLPDFIDVGVDVWFDAYDWHVRNRLTPAIGRDAVGRYTIGLLDTTLVMRPDLPQAAFVGAPYDSR